VSIAVTLTLGGGAIAATAAWRERRRATRNKAAIFDQCLGLFDRVLVKKAPDGYPRMSGYLDGRRVVLSLIPDTMTIKRLPQLWLSVTIASHADSAKMAIVARPRGDEFFCTTYRRRLPVPSWLPQDSAIYGETEAADALLERLRPDLESAFTDPRVKELSFGSGAIRALYRLAEGERGAHLLLRQAAFAPYLDQQQLAALCSMLIRVDRATGSLCERVAA
jgi:hypothetical protein